MADKCAKKLGAKGGKKGGPARDKKLSSEKKSEIARKGGIARTKKHGVFKGPHAKSKKK